MNNMMSLMERGLKSLGDDQPLTSKNPKPAEFVHPNKKLKTAYPAGGLAPGQKKKTGGGKPPRSN